MMRGLMKYRYMITAHGENEMKQKSYIYAIDLARLSYIWRNTDFCSRSRPMFSMVHSQMSRCLASS